MIDEIVWQFNRRAEPCGHIFLLRTKKKKKKKMFLNISSGLWRISILLNSKSSTFLKPTRNSIDCVALTFGQKLILLTK